MNTMNAPHTEPIPNPLQRQSGFSVTRELEAEVNDLLTHYPEKRAASLMVLHAIQDKFGWISQEAVEWTAKKLELQPINVYEIGDVLSDVAAKADGPVSNQGLPDVELRAGRRV